jgi:two-component system OmpR family sensor kinase
MFTTLYGKLAAVLLGLLCLLGALYILLTLFTTRLYFQEVTQKLNRTLAEHLVAENLPLREGQVDEQALKRIFHMLMVINPSIEIYLLDPHGTILAHSAPPGRVQRQQVSLQPLRRFLRGSDTFPILGDDPRHVNQQKVFSVSPVPVKGPLEGYLYVVLAGEAYDSVAHMLKGSYILRLSTWAVAVGLVFALVAGMLLFHFLTRRLRRLTAVMEAFKHSDFCEPVAVLQRFADHPIQTQRGDEIDRLEATFHAMAERLGQQVQTLQHTDILRRELVANVSHDLRTPLAALQGYLETLLLKEKQLTPEEQRHYLDIVTRHSERLGKLVSELFELAKLDSHDTQVHPEPFSLGELVQDVVQKFQLVAQKKNQRLQAHFAEELPFVCADIGLIERVLDNLIQNALQYTPAGGTITVALKERPTQIMVQVIDTGDGIPPEALPAIFDRFYRVEKHRQHAAGGAGLGLAITKRILDLHGCAIEAHSTLNGGTTFTFHLPIHR